MLYIIAVTAGLFHASNRMAIIGSTQDPQMDLDRNAADR